MLFGGGVDNISNGDIKSSRKRKNTSADNTLPKKSKDEHIKVIKCSLRSIIRDDVIYNKIQDDVIEMSLLAREASLLLYWDLIQKLETGDDCSSFKASLPYFYMLLDGSKNKYELPTQYNDLRNDFGLKKYDKTLRSNLFVQLSRQYDVIFDNNLWMHGYNRVKKFLRKSYCIYDNRVLYRVLKYLFHPSADDAIHLEADDPVPVWPRGYFSGLKRKSGIKYLHDFYLMWDANAHFNFKNFKLIPVYRSGRLYVNYDQFAFHQMLSSVKLCPKIQNAHGKLVACKYNQIKVEDYLTFPSTSIKDKFHGSFSTDGVACSIKLDSKEKSICVSEKNLTSDAYIGIDPGSKLFIGGVFSKGNTHTNVKYSSRQYHHECGFTERKNKLKKYTRNIDEVIETNRPSNQTPLEYIRFELEHYLKKQAMYIQRRVARLKFDAYIKKQKTLASTINKNIIKGETSVTVFFGDATQASNSPIKGYVRNPHSQLIKALKHHPKVKLALVDEYKTTKTCSGCFQDDQHTVYGANKHRFSSCTRCKIVWNRDINAGNNIFLMGYYNLILKFYCTLR